MTHLPESTPTQLPAVTGVDAVSLVCVRLLGVGDLGCAARVAGGWWWCPSRWSAHRTTSMRCWSAEQVNVLTQTPSAVGALSPQGLESVALLLGGEACPAEVVDRWAPGRVVINAYGPTEATVYASLSAPLERRGRSESTRCRSVRRCRPRRCSCSTSGCGRCRRVWSVSCMWRVVVWGLGIWAGRG